MERVHMFLGPSGILGMKYWVPWALLVWVVCLEETLNSSRGPDGKGGNCSWVIQTCWGKHWGEAMCLWLSGFARKGAGMGDMVMHKSSE